MSLGRRRLFRSVLISVVLVCGALGAQTPGQSSSSSSSSAKHSKKPAIPTELGMDAGAVNNGVYRNRTLGLSCKIPAGWVLRTDEMNTREEDLGSKEESNKPEPSGSAAASEGRRASLDRTAEGGCPHMCSRVLLAAFSRPPEARGEDVNASILIAAESAASYPGLKEAVQYFGPLTEVAKAQGFAVDEEPYEYAVGTKALVRGDFHRDVGSRVMRQSSLAMLAKGYAVSITVIGGTEDEVEELIDGLSLDAAKP
jgi:hypothetical protein